MLHVFLWFLGIGQSHMNRTHLFFIESEGGRVHCVSWRSSPSCSRYGETEDPSLEKVALDDITVFLMTVGDSSLVNTYSNALPARTPNLPSMTSVRVIRGWAAWKKGMQIISMSSRREPSIQEEETRRVTHSSNWEWSVSGAALAPPAGWSRCTTTGVENHVPPPSCRCTPWAPQLTTLCSLCTGCHWDRTCWTAFQNSSHSQKTYERGQEQDNVKSEAGNLS